MQQARAGAVPISWATHDCGIWAPAHAACTCWTAPILAAHVRAPQRPHPCMQPHDDRVIGKRCMQGVACRESRGHCRCLKRQHLEVLVVRVGVVVRAKLAEEQRRVPRACHGQPLGQRLRSMLARVSYLAVPAHTCSLMTEPPLARSRCACCLSSHHSPAPEQPPARLQFLDKRSLTSSKGVTMPVLRVCP
jgi:hypothetical protein